MFFFTIFTQSFLRHKIVDLTSSDSNTLLAEKAEYSNSKSYLIITDNVKVEDKKGTMFADKLFFDIKNQKLDITAFNNGKVNAEVKLK